MEVRNKGRMQMLISLAHNHSLRSASGKTAIYAKLKPLSFNDYIRNRNEALR